MQEIGTLETRSGGRLTVRASFADDLAVGESVAIQGACLTVTRCGGGTFDLDVSPTSFDLTTAGDWQPGRRLNLERAMALSDRLGGHIVSGHVDGVGRLIRREELEGGSVKCRFDLPSALATGLVPQGSITIDGVSLTLNEVDDEAFGVTLIPETLRKTTFGNLTPGSTVNLETDVIGKYVQRLMAAYAHVRM